MNTRMYLQNHLAMVNKGDFNKPLVAIDLETEGLGGSITRLAMSGPDGNSTLSPRILKAPPFNNGLWVYSGGAYDINSMVREELSVPRGILLDTIPAAWLLDENRKRFGLKWVTQDWIDHRSLGVRDEDFRVWMQGWKGNKDDPEALTKYAKYDTMFTRQLMLQMWPKLKEQGLLTQFLKVEAPMMLIQADMERKGIRLDRTLLESQWKETGEESKNLRKQLREIFDGPVWDCERCNGTGVYEWKRGNKRSECTDCSGTGDAKVLNSPDKLPHLLHEVMGLPVIDTTETGNPSTRSETLEKLIEVAKDQRVRKWLNTFIRYKEVNKLFNTFYDPYMELGTDRIYPSWNPWGTVTGRYSCKEPNLMQVPPRVRNVFLPDEGYKFIDVDYRQLEMYLLGYMAGETKLTKEYEESGDIHQGTADIAGVTRDEAKAVNFGTVYGLSTANLANRINCSKSRAAEIQEHILGSFPKISDWMQQQKREGRRRGYVQTILGRRRRLPALQSSSPRERAHGENQAVNAPIQGSAADLMKVAQIKLYLDVPAFDQQLQVHDELVGQVREEEALDTLEEVCYTMEHALKGVKAKVDGNVIERWKKL